MLCLNCRWCTAQAARYRLKPFFARFVQGLSCTGVRLSRGRIPKARFLLGGKRAGRLMFGGEMECFGSIPLVESLRLLGKERREMACTQKRHLGWLKGIMHNACQNLKYCVAEAIHALFPNVATHARVLFPDTVSPRLHTFRTPLAANCLISRQAGEREYSTSCGIREIRKQKVQAISSYWQ